MYSCVVALHPPVIVMLSNREDSIALLLEAARQGLMNGDYVFFLLQHFEVSGTVVSKTLKTQLHRSRTHLNGWSCSVGLCINIWPHLIKTSSIPYFIYLTCCKMHWSQRDLKKTETPFKGSFTTRSLDEI